MPRNATSWQVSENYIRYELHQKVRFGICKFPQNKSHDCKCKNKHTSGGHCAPVSDGTHSSNRRFWPEGCNQASFASSFRSTPWSLQQMHQSCANPVLCVWCNCRSRQKHNEIVAPGSIWSCRQGPSAQPLASSSLVSRSTAASKSSEPEFLGMDSTNVLRFAAFSLSWAKVTRQVCMLFEIPKHHLFLQQVESPHPIFWEPLCPHIPNSPKFLLWVSIFSSELTGVSTSPPASLLGQALRHGGATFCTTWVGTPTFLNTNAIHESLLHPTSH